MSKLKNTTILENIRAVIRLIFRVLPSPAALAWAVALSAFTLGGVTVNTASAQTPTKGSEIVVHTAPEQAASLVETVRDGGLLTPIAETISDGVKWFLVKTKNGNTGWIKSDDNAETKKMDDHFRALPKDAISVGPPDSASATATKISETGLSRIPILVRSSRVYVLVTFNKRVRKYLKLDTGAYQTVISKRIASDLNLPAIARRTSYGVAGPITHDVGLLDSMRVGAYEVRNFRVNIFDHSNVPNEEGLLGFDFLGLFHMSVDSEKQEMVLTARRK